jgi:CubicO group peptidase (beta-lactamase class C family)
VRELGKNTPVDEHTLFAIASCSKAFTAAALAVLIDEGKIRWEDPVIRYLPELQLCDPWVTREMQVRDLLSHRSGLATFGGDLVWYWTKYDRKEVLRRIRYLKPVSSFRSQYGYQNIMFIAAGEIIPAVTGKTWDEFVRERFFIPLGMTTTITTHREIRTDGNVAAPHNEYQNKLRVIKHYENDNMAPAGGIISSIHELAQWMRLQLGQGTYQGRRIFSAAASRMMWSPHIFQPISPQAQQRQPSTHFQAYGLGWGLRDYEGRKIVTHGGAIDGMTSRIMLVPEEKLGVMVVTNSESSLSAVIAQKVVDIFLGAPERDWSGEFLKLREEGSTPVPCTAMRQSRFRTGSWS